MEALRKIRTQHRRLFTKACNEFEKEKESLDNENKISKLKLIEEKAKLMIECDEKIKQELCDVEIDEKLLEAEIDESECYIDRWRILEQTLKQLTIYEKESFIPSFDILQQNTALRYPKIQLPTFNGDIRNWLSFWGQFQKIDNDTTLDLHDKFSYLRQAMEKGSIAEELIKSFPPGGASYVKAVRQLKNRFGNEELLIQVYVRDLLSLVLQKQTTERKSLRKLYDLLETKLRSLEILGVTRDKYASMLFPLVESSLPEDTLRVWERYRATNRRSREAITEEQNSPVPDKNDLDSILEFLQDEVAAEERINLASQSFSFSRVNTKVDDKYHQNKRFTSNKLKFGNTSQIPSAADLFTSAKGPRPCIFCTNFHNSESCIKARKMTLKERENLVEKSRCCFLCLKPAHQVRQCNLKIGCLCCGKKHHVLLCRNLVEKRHAISPKKETVKSEKCVLEDQALANVSQSPSVMLQTLMVIIRGDNGKRRKVRAIIDSASQRSYLLKSTANEMGYEAKDSEYLQHSLFGGNDTGVCKHDIFTLYLTSVDGSYNCNFKVLSQPVICDSVPPVAYNFCEKELIASNIPIIDSNKGPIEVLIGADVAGKLLTGGYKTLFCGLSAIETKLGWTLMGRIDKTASEERNTLLMVTLLSLNNSVSALWSLDTLGITDPSEQKTKTELHEAAKKHFLETVRVENDRFIVHLPWLEDHSPLADNYNLALKRLNTTVKRLKAQSLYEEYEEVFHSWLEEKIIEKVHEKPKMSVHYLPHRPVIKENSTTRIRPVLDASAKTKGSPSLNDCLEKGENLIELIPNILTRFRREKIGVIGDIRKAFLQISIIPDDRDYLRFLWYSSDGDIIQYRHCRVVFGVSCSPFLLGSTIQYHLQTVLEKIRSGDSSYSRSIIEKLLNSFYVDNCVTSVKSESDLNEFIKVSSEVMAEKSFELRGWEHTDTNALYSAETNVLGLVWNKQSDCLRINTKRLEGLCLEKITKRTILSAAHRIFDPIGLTCPVSLKPKLLLQKIWKMKLTWDDKVDSETEENFLKWIEDLNYLEAIQLPRFIGDCEAKQCSVHFFCDASKYAYAAVAFLRVETSTAVKVRFLQARSRIAPTGKEITIARLELLAATIASRLSVTMLPELKYDEVNFWTDSTTVLAWITREEAWGIFVYNRVKEIRELTNKGTWKHIPGTKNPADLPSRGCSAQYLLKSKWWEGPQWLYLPREEWPNANLEADEEEIHKELKKTVISSVTNCLTTAKPNCDTENWYYKYFSKYSKIVNLIGWVIRFFRNCRSLKHNRKSGNLDSREILEAEKRVIKLIQSECFQNERDKIFNNLRAFTDESGVIRLKTKLVHRQDSEDFKTPAILPSQHEVVKRLIFYHHVKHSHAGTQILLNILRERFWILDGRRTIRSVVSKCVTCKRYFSKRMEAVAAPLPEDRIRSAAVFEICGIDLAGPLYLKGNQKSWICLFTCAIYRPVHLELVTSLSTEAFLLALRRFIARRGRCKVIYTDNGTNFVGASNLFRSLDWDRITADTIVNQIEWKFNPPTASWWGGWWERLIGILKGLLRKVLGHTSLTYEEMATVLCDCESVINSRPLTYIAENDELIPLSPATFLQEIQNCETPDCDAVDHKSLNKRAKYRQNLQNHLRKRFRSEYLGALIQKSDHNRSSEVSIGDIVLIGNDNNKRMNWPLGKIIEIMPGKDGVTRLVKLQTIHGQILRPIQRLYPLEISASDPLTAHVNTSVSDKEKSTTRDCKTASPAPVVTRAGRVIKIPNRLGL